MQFHILTLFPEMVENGLKTSILGRAVDRGLIGVHAVNIRDYTADRHGRVDDYPYGGGAGMLMQAQPVYDAFCALQEQSAKKAPLQEQGAKKAPLRVIYLTPQGRVFDQKMAEELAKEEELVFLCGHYEGIDERVLEEIVTDQVSIGDYVLTGGELPAMVMIDAISRMVPGVLKNEESGETESFRGDLLEYPQYTRPEVWRDKAVPAVLLSGDHAKVEKWRLEQSIDRTRQRRPDLYERYDLPGRALDYLKQERLLHRDMIEDIRRRQAQVLAVLSDGVLLQDKRTGIYMVTARNRDAGERLLSMTDPDGAVFCCHQKFLMQSVADRFHKTRINECFQTVYTKKTPLPEEKTDICRIFPLGEGDLDLVCEHYHTLADRETLAGLLREGSIFAASVCEEGKAQIAGFIGTHAEGGMGLLEVFPPFRRRKIGQALVSFLINRTLEKGWTPYGQIFTDNEPSLKLQEKLGMRLCPGTLYWIS